MSLERIALDELVAHRANSNVMPADRFEKLVGHIDRGGRYPPIIVRPRRGDSSAGRYQILDGHHRALALRRLGRTHADCLVWEVDDAQALVLLGTLNRLQGRDDPRKRAALLEALSQTAQLDAPALARLLPEHAADVQRLLALSGPPPRPAPPVAVHFFLDPTDRRQLEAALARLGPTREAALMTLVRRAGAG